MATVAALRAGLAGALRTAFTDAQVSEYPLGNPTPPGFEIDVDDEGINYDQAMGRGIDEWWFLVRGFVSQSLDVGSQRRRDEWLASSGTSSVKAALETDRTLGGTCHAIRVVTGRPRSFTTATNPNATYAGAEWRVRVIASG